MNEDDAIRLFFELGMLKRIKHEGWRLIGIENPGSVGEHALRAAQIGYILAEMEGEDPKLVASILVWHEIAECRIGDRHRVANRYTQVDEISVVREQVQNLGKTGQDIIGFFKEIEDKSTKAGQIAKEADYLEMCLTAKEYMEKGYAQAVDWINNSEKSFKTESAKKLSKLIRETDSNCWWQGLKKLKI